MSNRDWEKELAMIDKQLASISDEALSADSPPAPASSPAAPGKAPARPPAAPQGAVTRAAAVAGAATVSPLTWRQRGALLLGLGLAVGVSVMAVVWPFATRCGVDLAAYLGAVLLVILAGVWTSLLSWRLRAGRTHLLSLLAILWGLGLGAWQVLPRVGLALPTESRPAIWSCG